MTLLKKFRDNQSLCNKGREGIQDGGTSSTDIARFLLWILWFSEKITAFTIFQSCLQENSWKWSISVKENQLESRSSKELQICDNEFFSNEESYIIICFLMLWICIIWSDFCVWILHWEEKATWWPFMGWDFFYLIYSVTKNFGYIKLTLSVQICLLSI